MCAASRAHAPLLASKEGFAYIAALTPKLPTPGVGRELVNMLVRAR